MRSGLRTMAGLLCFMLVLQILPLSGLSLATAGTQESVGIHFQPYGRAAPEGAYADYGETYGLHQGLEFGWNIPHTDAGVQSVTYGQTGGSSSNIRMKPGGKWEIQLDNGQYEVTVSVGDAVYASRNTLFVEGIPFFEQVGLPENGVAVAVKTISLTDGRLTIGSSDGETAAIQSVQIKRIESLILRGSVFNTLSDSIGAPRISAPPEPHLAAGDKVLMSGRMVNEHQAPPYIPVSGLKEEIGRYMTERVQAIDQAIGDYGRSAQSCANCSANSISQAIGASASNPVVIQSGHLNLESSATFGSPSKPVVLIVDGINTNRNLTIELYGVLIVKGNVNANTDLAINIHSPSSPLSAGDGSLWVTGSFHLNSNSSVRTDGEIAARSLIYNNGQLDIQADRLLVDNQFHINTKVNMNIRREMAIGELVSNNQTATIEVRSGDLFVRDNVSVNNQLLIRTGGWAAVGGNMTANARPVIQTGYGDAGQTSLKFTLHGLKADYFSQGNMAGTPYTKLDETVDVNRKPNLPAAGFNDNDFSVSWTGQIEPLYSEMYRFEAQARGAVRLWINDALVLEDWNENRQGSVSGSVYLESGRRVNIRMEYSSTDGNPNAALHWQSPSQSKEKVPQNRLYPFAVPQIHAVTGETEIVLNWSPAFNAVGYELEADGTILPLGVQQSYFDPQLESGTIHAYRVRAYAGGLIGEWSLPMAAWTLPGIPDNLRVQSTSTSVKLEWDTVRGATGYDVELDGSIKDNGPGNEYVNDQLSPSPARTYKVRAKNASGEGNWAQITSQVIVPDIPSVVATEPAESSIRITWSRVLDAMGYDLEIDGVVVNAGDQAEYIHNSLPPYTTHSYRVRARNAEGTGPWTTATESTTLPRVPGTISSDLVSDDTIRISWPSLQEANEYEVEADGIVHSAGASTGYTHSGLVPNSEHHYRVRVKNAKAIGQWSDRVSRLMPPAKPVHLQAIAASDKIELSWEPVEGAVSYEVEIDGQPIDAGSETFYSHEGVNANSPHTYRVRARNAGGPGAWSEDVAVSALIGRPTNVSATASSSFITVSWDAVPGAERYDISADGEQVDNGQATAFVHDGLMPNTWHQYRVRAFAGGIPGEWTEALSKATLSPANAAPHIGPPAEQRKVPGDKALISGRMTNEHQAPPYLPISGLKEEIGRYMAERVWIIDQAIADYGQTAQSCANCSADAIIQAIGASPFSPVVIKAGHLNLESSATFGSPSKPVVLIVDGMNTNRKLSLDLYGVLVVTGSMNANTELTLNVHSPSSPLSSGNGSLWVTGSFHLNNNSSIRTDGEIYAGSLIYNNGQMDVRTESLLVANQMHINTNADMSIRKEMAVGELVANNQTALIEVNGGDLFVRDNISVNNQLDIRTGGWFAVGGDMTANRRPMIRTGFGDVGETSLKFTLHGLKAEYFSQGNLTGTPYTKLDETIDVHRKPILPVAGFNDNDFSVRWTGQVEPLYDELYRFETQARGAVRLWINGALVLEDWNENRQGTVSGTVLLEAGKRADIRMEYSSADGNPRAALYWQSASQGKEQVPQSRLFPFALPQIAALPTETDMALNWSSSFNATGYELEMDGNITPLDAVQSYIHRQLESGTVHAYRVRANAGDLIGQWSEPLAVWTLPGIPDHLRLQSTSTSVRLEWDAVRGATGYDIEFSGSVLDNGPATAYLDDQLNPNMQRTYRVRAKNASGPGKWTQIAAQVTLPGVPSDFRAQPSESGILVAWDRVSGALGYDLEADGIVVDAGEGSSFRHEPLQPYTTHTYRVRARNAEGTSPWSAVLESTTLPRVPGTPVTELVAGNTILLTWSEVAEASEYEVEVDGVVISSGGFNSYTHSGLAPNSEHHYRVRVHNAKATGQWSERTTRIVPPGKPANVQAAAASDKIELTWEPVAGAVSYEVEADGATVDVGQVTIYVHQGVDPHSAHLYRIRAWNAGGPGAWSEDVAVSTLLGRPMNVSATAAATSITVNWDGVPGAESYDVLADGELVDNGTSTFFIHEGLSPYTWHVYRIRAKAGGVSGEWTDTLSKATRLGVPGNIRLQASSTSMTVSWDGVSGATGYEVEADGVFADNGMYTTFIHGNLAPNSLHTYRIRAMNEDGAGEWSSERSEWSLAVHSPTAPGIPANVQAVAATDSITLSWNPVTGASGYMVEADGQSVSISGTSYKHETLEPNTMHEYRVKAVNGQLQSGWTPLLEQATVPELTVRVEKGTWFNLVVVAPEKPGADERIVTVLYRPEQLDVIDLSALTPTEERTTGPIVGTDITVTEYSPGRIVYRIGRADKTVMNSIRFLSLTSDYPKITYTID